MSAFRHIVLFRIHDEVPEERVTEAIDALRSLGVLPGIQSWAVELSLDRRKGRVIVEDGVFSDQAAFEAFHAAPLHRSTAQAMAEISDWWVGDYQA